MTWTTIKPRCGDGKRTKPAIHRNQRGEIRILWPAVMVTAKRVRVASDGGGRLAFTFTDDGEYAVWFPAGSGARMSTVPAEFRHHIPVGTTDVNMSRAGDAWVLDLNELPA
jgi:hypothetical protein